MLSRLREVEIIVPRRSKASVQSCGQFLNRILYGVNDDDVGITLPCGAILRLEEPAYQSSYSNPLRRIVCKAVRIGDDVDRASPLKVLSLSPTADGTSEVKPPPTVAKGPFSITSMSEVILGIDHRDMSKISDYLHDTDGRLNTLFVTHNLEMILNIILPRYSCRL